MRLKSRLITEIELFPEVFPDWVPKKLNELQSKSSWNDYYEVLDRLNAPELVDYFVKKQISYQYYWAIPGYRGSQGNAYYVFNNKKGDCLYISTFIVKALQRNGYRAWVEKMPPVSSVGEYHAVCVFKLNGEKYIIDDGRGAKRGIMKYPEYLRYSYTSLPKSFY